MRFAVWVGAWAAYWLAFTLSNPEWELTGLYIGILLAGVVAFAVGRPQVLWVPPILFAWVAIHATVNASAGTEGAGGAAAITGIFLALYSAGVMLVGLAARAALSSIRRRLSLRRSQQADR